MNIFTERPPDTCHHFMSVEMPAEDGTIKQGCHCGICHLTILGVWVGELPPCANHWHERVG